MPYNRTASEWATENLVIPPPQTQRPGPFSLAGCEYLREPIDFFSTAGLSSMALLFGSQSGKTTVMQAGVAYTIACRPTTLLWVMPAHDLAQSFSSTRWQPIVRATKPLADLIPTGQSRHDFTKSEQQLGGATLNFVGSNSPGNLSSRPVSVVILDEVDKFPAADEEADPIQLAEQRTKDRANPKHAKASTPTTTDGLIWGEWLMGDQRRYQMPCPHCSKRVILAWSAEYALMKPTGLEAWMKWDAEARRGKGDWDLARVYRSARCICPHCAGDIEERHKTTMVRNGVWVPTAAGNSSRRSYHYPSLGASSPATSFGELAIAFLRGLSSPSGIQSFVTGNLAEPYEQAGQRSARLVSVAIDATPPEQPIRIMTVDVQAVAPLFWIVIREWGTNNHSRLVAAYHCDDWEAVRAVQLACGVEDTRVLLDAKYSSEEVFRQCFRWGKRIVNGGVRTHLGWTPAMGRESDVTWIDEKTKRSVPLTFPKKGAAVQHGQPFLNLLMFNGDYLMGHLSRFKKGPERCGGVRFEFIDLPAGPEVPGATRVTMEDYNTHLDAKVMRGKIVGRGMRTEWKFEKRTGKWPDHLNDCEIMQLAYAMVHRRLRLDPDAEVAK